MALEGKAGAPALVIAGFILAFLFPPLGILLCVLGLGEAKRRGEGVGLAQIGIVIGLVILVIGGIVFLG